MRFSFDGFAKSQKPPYSVIPAKAGIQYFYILTKFLDPVFQRGDDFVANPSPVLSLHFFPPHLHPAQDNLQDLLPVHLIKSSQNTQTP